jgi:hypothetical protein
LDEFLISSDWNKLIGSDSQKASFTDTSAHLRSNGNEIVYRGGTRILSLKGNRWKNYEKVGVRWEETESDKESVEVLNQYLQYLEKSVDGEKI